MAASSQQRVVVDRAECNVCAVVGSFGASGAEYYGEGTEALKGPGLREQLACGSCGAISRERALIYTLGCLLGEAKALEHWSPRPELRVLETSGYRGHPVRLGRLFDYFNTTYLPPEELPPEIDGRTRANLEDLPYPDGFFDVLLSGEVLEHVQRIEPALSEIHRVLAPDGFAVITAPYVHEWARTSTRVHRWHDRDVVLYPQEYHGEHTLVYRVFGRDLHEQLRRLGFAVSLVRIVRGENAISAMDVIIASKAPFTDISHFLAS